MTSLINTNTNTDSSMTPATMVKKFRNDPYNTTGRVYLKSSSSSPASSSSSSCSKSVASPVSHEGGAHFAAGTSTPKMTATPSKQERDEYDHVVAPADVATAATGARPVVHAASNNRQFKNTTKTLATSSSSDDDAAVSMNSSIAVPVAALALDGDELLAGALVENNALPSPTVRAPTRTMQHLLQNVPYLFLDTVSRATVLTQERSVSHSTRVGDSVSAWSCSRAAAEAALSTAGAIRDVFVAQLPFDMPLSALQELADLLLPGEEIQVLHAAPHFRKPKHNDRNPAAANSGHQTYDGCAFVKMAEAHAHRFIDTFHKRVLFDVDGVWVASSDSAVQQQEMTCYCAWMQEQKQEQRRHILPMPTPFSAMTAEFAMRAQRSQQQQGPAPMQQQQQQYYGQQQQFPQHSAPRRQHYGGVYPQHQQHQQQRFSAPPQYYGQQQQQYSTYNAGY